MRLEVVWKGYGWAGGGGGGGAYTRQVGKEQTRREAPEGGVSLKCPRACPGCRSARPCGAAPSSRPLAPLAPGLSSWRHSGGQGSRAAVSFPMGEHLKSEAASAAPGLQCLPELGLG